MERGRGRWARHFARYSLIRFISMHSVYQGRHAVRNLAWRYTRAREFFMRTSFNAGGTRVPLEKAITHTAYSKNHFLFFPSILFANTSAPCIFIQRFITFVRSNARRRFVPTFSFVIVKTTCVCKRERERDWIARFSCTTIEILFVPRKLTVQPSIDAHSIIFDDITWSVKRRFFRFSLALYFPGVDSWSFCVRITWNLLHSLMQLMPRIDI